MAGWERWRWCRGSWRPCQCSVLPRPLPCQSTDEGVGCYYWISFFAFRHYIKVLHLFIPAFIHLNKALHKSPPQKSASQTTTLIVTSSLPWLISSFNAGKSVSLFNSTTARIEFWVLHLEVYWGFIWVFEGFFYVYWVFLGCLSLLGGFVECFYFGFGVVS